MKNFKTMSTSRLQKELERTSVQEEIEAINAELQARANDEESVKVEDIEKAAESNAESNAEKYTEDEKAALADACLKYKGHAIKTRSFDPETLEPLEFNGVCDSVQLVSRGRGKSGYVVNLRVTSENEKGEKTIIRVPTAAVLEVGELKKVTRAASATISVEERAKFEAEKQDYVTRAVASHVGYMTEFLTEDGEKKVGRVVYVRAENRRCCYRAGVQVGERVYNTDFAKLGAPVADEQTAELNANAVKTRAEYLSRTPKDVVLAIAFQALKARKKALQALEAFNESVEALKAVSSENAERANTMAERLNALQTLEEVEALIKEVVPAKLESTEQAE